MFCDTHQKSGAGTSEYTYSFLLSSIFWADFCTISEWLLDFFSICHERLPAYETLAICHTSQDDLFIFRMSTILEGLVTSLLPAPLLTFFFFFSHWMVGSGGDEQNPRGVPGDGLFFWPAFPIVFLALRLKLRS